MSSAQTPDLCVDSQRQPLVMPFPLPSATGRDELLITAKALLVHALKTTESLLTGFPIPVAKGTIGAVLHFIAEAERYATNAELCDELRKHILGLHKQLIQPLVGKAEENIPPDTLVALEDFTERIGRGLERLRHPMLSKYGRFRRFLLAKEIEGDLRMVMDLIRLDTESHLVGGVQRLELAVQQVEDRQSDSKRQDALDKLRRAPEAKLDSNVQPLDEDGKLILCFENTRAAILDKIMKWVSDPSAPPIFWLHGLAGTGKSTIARTVGVRAKEAGCITASFFFSGVGTAGRRDPAYVFPTLAHQLAASDKDLNRIIGDAVIGSSDVDHGMVLGQFQTLIAAPLDAWHAESKNAGHILIILDAVDECQGVEYGQPQQILACLRDHNYRAPSHVRLLLTSRPKHHIKQALGSQSQVLEYDLHLNDESAQGDIAQFLKAKIPLIPPRLGISVEGWPRDEDVKALSQKSGHLFIFAKTALRFIGDDQVLDPRRQMNILLGMGITTVNPYSPIDDIYHQVLDSALSEARVPDDIFLCFRRVVGCIILSQDALSVSEIAIITDYSVDEVMAMLRRTHSVMHSSPPGTVNRREADLSPRIYHPSFSDYLVDAKRCVDPHFTIVTTETHGFIVLRCFQLMKAVLRRNILDLPKRFIPNIFIPDFQAKVQSTLTPQRAYACQFWISHLLESKMDEEILEALREFLSQRFLWWCEALSLLGSTFKARVSLGAAASSLRVAWERLSKASCDPEITDLLNDTYRFLISHHSAISGAAMYTYYTALPFTPHHTRLYCLYERETSQSITVLQGLDPIWSSSLANSFMRNDTSIFLVSPDGRSLAVGGRDCISLWDTQATVLQRYLHIDSIFLGWDDRAPHNKNSPAISFSKNTVATVWRERLYISDVTTATERVTRELSGNCVYAAAFSLGGQYLLLSMDQNLHLYRGTDAIELAVLPTDQHHTSVIFTRDDGQVITGSKEGQVHFFSLSGGRLSEIPGRSIPTQAGVVGLVLCHDGQRLATSGMDGTIRIYDLLSLACVATLQRPGGGSAINAIACHPKEDELAAGQDEYLVLWRKETAGDWVPSIHGHHTSPIIGVGYCESGTQIYTGSQDGNVKLWENTKTQFGQSPKHTETITCYAVDSRASLLATGSRDMSVILWRLTTGDYLRTLLSHKRETLSLEFSEDGVLLASGGSDNSAVVWDVASGNILHVLGPHDGCGRVLAFSEDHRHLITATTQEINVWELNSGELMEFRERDTRVNDAPKRPYSAFTFSDKSWIERTQEVYKHAQEAQAEAQESLAQLQGMLAQAQGGLVWVQEAQAQVPEAVMAQVPEAARVALVEAPMEALKAVKARVEAALKKAEEEAEKTQGRALKMEATLKEMQKEATLLTQMPSSSFSAHVLAQVPRFNDYEIWAAKYLRCRLLVPPQHRVDTSLVLQDRMVLLCKDGSVLILDTSRMEAELWLTDCGF